MSSHQDSLQTFRWHYDEFNDTNFQLRGRTLFFIVVIFSIILLVTLLFIYTRWVCRVVSPPPSSSSTSAAAPPPPRGLDMVTINNMPIVLYKSAAAAAAGNHFSEGGECCICLGIFVEKETVKVLPPCRHCFHSECVDMWLVTQSSCPLCRASLRVDSPV